MTVLGIETSCDDTAVAVVRNGELIADTVYSQLVHQKWGGVVPELASRDHAKKILTTVRTVVEDAGIELSDLDGIAVTSGPGLLGSVLVGVTFAKALSWMLDIPIVGINHIEAHIFGALLDRKPPVPFIAMIVSGGHTHMYLSEKPGEYSLLGKTRDDAAGETFDKVAKFLGFPYPGGPHIQKLAEKGDASKIDLPIGMKRPGNLEFSFSGLKTAALNVGKGITPVETDFTPEDLAASLQETIADTLLLKIREAMKQTDVKRLVVSGGVVANSLFRRKIEELSQEGVEVILPLRKHCTDNGVMVAFAGAFRLEKGDLSPVSFPARPVMPLDKNPYAR